MATVSAEHARTHETLGRDFRIVGETLGRDFLVQQMRQVLFWKVLDFIPSASYNHVTRDPMVPFPFVQSKQKLKVLEKQGLIQKSRYPLTINSTSDLIR